MATKLSTYERNRRNVTRWKREQYRDCSPSHKQELENKILSVTYPCPGEAHSNSAGHDHCGVCAPLWGRVVRAFTDDELCEVLQHATSEPLTEESFPFGSMEYHAMNEARALGYLTDEFSDMDPIVNVTYFFLNDRGRDLVFQWRATRKVASK